MTEIDHISLSDLTVNLKKAELFSYYNDTDKEGAINEYNLLTYMFEDQGDISLANAFTTKSLKWPR
jgi:hypothetical protein